MSFYIRESQLNSEVFENIVLEMSMASRKQLFLAAENKWEIKFI